MIFARFLLQIIALFIKCATPVASLRCQNVGTQMFDIDFYKGQYDYAYPCRIPRRDRPPGAYFSASAPGYQRTADSKPGDRSFDGLLAGSVKSTVSPRVNG